uniref:Uncharacterized protein n=1 Tax=viral metagenome TaxID=1070528 RepID=A0A6M3JAC4_9ZZZZ
MRKLLITLAALLLLGAGSDAQAQTVPADSAKTFVGAQYFHNFEGPDRGHNTGTVIAGVRIAGNGNATRWYFGAEMVDQESPKGKGGIGPSLIMVSDIGWFSYKRKPVVSVLGSLSWVDAAKYDPATQNFRWGLWTGLGVLFHVSDDAKVTIAATGSPGAEGFIDNIGVGPGLFVTDPEQHVKKVVEGAWDKVSGIIEAIL